MSDRPLMPSDAPHLTLLLGGVRSGKSARAVSLAAEWAGAGRVLFVATAQTLDGDMTRRIEAHRAERPAGWDTLESPVELVAELERALVADAVASPYDVIVIDCMTLWVSNILLSLHDADDADDADHADHADDAERVTAERVEQLMALRAARATSAGGRVQRWIVVSNEVGLGIVPATSLGRRYRDALGRANRIVAAAANEVTLMVAGIELSLRSSSTVPQPLVSTSSDPVP